MPTYLGSCHCGAVRYEVTAEITELTRCDCSLCSRKNALMAAVPKPALSLLTAWDEMTEYNWNTGVARHFFCRTCGIYTFHQKRSAPDHYGINVRTLEGFDPGQVPVREASGAGMSVEPDTARAEWPGPRAGTDAG